MTGDLNALRGDPHPYVHLTYGPWESSGHQCGDVQADGCDEPIPERKITARYADLDGERLVGYELGDCPSCGHAGSGDLRDRIAEALYQWTLAVAGGRRLIPPDEAILRENSQARADAVLPVVQAELDAACEEIDELATELANERTEHQATIQRAEQAEAAEQRARNLAQALRSGDDLVRTLNKEAAGLIVAALDDRLAEHVAQRDAAFRTELERQLAAESESVHEGDEEPPAPVDWQAIARQRERELKDVAEVRHQAEAALQRVRALLEPAPTGAAFAIHRGPARETWTQAVVPVDRIQVALDEPDEGTATVHADDGQYRAAVARVRALARRWVADMPGNVTESAVRVILADAGQQIIAALDHDQPKETP